MARLTRDALVLQARMDSSETMTITQIAIRVFRGNDPGNPKKPTAVSIQRATRAAASLVSCAQAIAVRKDGEYAIKSTDESGGALQAQALMNLVVRGSNERRIERGADFSPDQRAEDRRDKDLLTATPPRRMIRHTTRRQVIAPQEEARPAKWACLRYTEPPPGSNIAPSPFDIKRPVKTTKE